MRSCRSLKGEAPLIQVCLGSTALEARDRTLDYSGMGDGTQDLVPPRSEPAVCEGMLAHAVGSFCYLCVRSGPKGGRFMNTEALLRQVWGRRGADDTDRVRTVVKKLRRSSATTRPTRPTSSTSTAWVTAWQGRPRHGVPGRARRSNRENGLRGDRSCASAAFPRRDRIPCMHSPSLVAISAVRFAPCG